jgi:type III pantothenate kinase
MILCLDVGNSQIFGGVFVDDKIKLRFRHNTTTSNSSDEMGLFLKNVIRENGLDPEQITHIAICSVVPQLVYSLTNCCKKYFSLTPFLLQAGVKTGLKVNYRNPLEVGADRIANSIAATHLYPNKNIIVADLGTATTLCVVTKNKDYLGGLILPGMKLCMEVLEAKTAKLPSVEIVKVKNIVGRSTVESIQSGLFHGHLFAIQGMVEKIRKEHFEGEDVVVLGTGGFARLFENENLFQHLLPDLVLQGLHMALKNNL